MNRLKVVEINSNVITFDDGTTLYSEHDTRCCEDHYLSMQDLTLEDFDGLVFDLTTDNFFERIEDYGIALKPIHGHSVKIPGYGSNNGCYSEDINLVIENIERKFIKTYDVTNCQVVTYR